MIYVTGEFHGVFDPLYKFSQSKEGKSLTKSDYVIALGDFGVWPQTINAIKKLNENLNFTLLFLEGNHEHYLFLDTFPTRQMFGGKVHDVFGIYHLCRSEIYSFLVGSKKITIAVCGGGDSRDKAKRTEGVDWFAQEKILRSDVTSLLEKAKNYGMKVDYFLSHSLSAAVKIEWNYEYECCRFLAIPSCELLESDFMIRDIAGVLEAKKYLSAHEHIDRNFLLCGKEYCSVYRNFVKLC